MARWFRFYDETLDDPKVQRLNDTLYRRWTDMLCIASRNDGQITADIAALAFMTRQTPAKTQAAVTALCDAGLLDRDGDDFTPHGWRKRQYDSDSSAERMRRHRDRKRDADVTSHPPSPPVTGDAVEQIQSRADTEQSRERERASRARPINGWDSEFSEFWAVYPRHDDRKRAYAAYGKALKAAEHRIIVEGAQRYCQDPNREPKFTKQAATWLNAEAWNNGPLPGEGLDRESLDRLVDEAIAKDHANGIA